VAGGAIPTYEHVYFGYQEQLRGWYRTVFEGEDLAGINLELRRFILSPRVFRVNSLPIPEEFTVWKFGISVAVFANAGTTWFRGDKLTWTSIQSGYGAGIHWLLPYSYVMRTEYAWNQFGQGQFILDFRASI
jgi:hypothetical protein